MAHTEIVRLKITLHDVTPPVVRRVEVPRSILLSDLHVVIQIVMPWWNYHLYEFRIRDNGWGIPGPDGSFGGGPRDARKATLAEILDATNAKSLTYTYDFGDDWAHKIRLERTSDAEPGITYPRLLEAKGRCPPEDCGGPWGYEAYLAAISDPQHENHDEMIEWRGPGFDPKTVDVAAIEKELAKLATRWSRKKTKKPRDKPA